MRPLAQEVEAAGRGLYKGVVGESSPHPHLSHRFHCRRFLYCSFVLSFHLVGACHRSLFAVAKSWKWLRLVVLLRAGLLSSVRIAVSSALCGLAPVVVLRSFGDRVEVFTVSVSLSPRRLVASNLGRYKASYPPLFAASYLVISNLLS